LGDAAPATTGSQGAVGELPPKWIRKTVAGKPKGMEGGVEVVGEGEDALARIHKKGKVKTGIRSVKD